MKVKMEPTMPMTMHMVTGVPCLPNLPSIFGAAPSRAATACTRAEPSVHTEAEPTNVRIMRAPKR